MNADTMQGLATVAAWAVVASLGVFAASFLVVWAVGALQSAAHRRRERKRSSMQKLLRMEADRAWQWDESKTYRRRTADTGAQASASCPVSGGRWDSDGGSDSGSDGGSSGGGE